MIQPLVFTKHFGETVVAGNDQTTDVRGAAKSLIPNRMDDGDSLFKLRHAGSDASISQL